MSAHFLRRQRRYALGESGTLSSVAHPTAVSWAARVIANGGAGVSGATLTAASKFCYALDSAAITTDILCCNIIAPDNLIAALTPLIKGASSDPWTNSGFLLADLSSSGLQGNSVKYMDTGFNAQSHTSANNLGCSIYAKTLVQANYFQIGAFNTGFCGIRARFGDGTSKGAAPDNGNYAGTTYPGSAGYFSINRVSSTDLRLFWGNGGNAHAQVGSTVAVANAIALPNRTYFAFAYNGGAPTDTSSDLLNFFALNNGLSAAKSASLMAAVQQLRVSLGGSV